MNIFFKRLYIKDVVMDNNTQYLVYLVVGLFTFWILFAPMKRYMYCDNYEDTPEQTEYQEETESENQYQDDGEDEAEAEYQEENDQVTYAKSGNENDLYGTDETVTYSDTDPVSLQAICDDNPSCLGFMYSKSTKMGYLKSQIAKSS
jgi:hypothetical protein